MSGKHDPLGASAAEMLECGWNGAEEIRQSWNRFWEEIPGGQRSIWHGHGFPWRYAGAMAGAGEAGDYDKLMVTDLCFPSRARGSRREMIASGHAKRYTER